MGISEGRHPFSRLGERCYLSLSNHVIECALYLLSVLYRYLPLGMLDQSSVRVSPDGIGTGHIANCVKQAAEGMFDGNYVLGCHIKK